MSTATTALTTTCYTLDHLLNDIVLQMNTSSNNNNSSLKKKKGDLFTLSKLKEIWIEMSNLLFHQLVTLHKNISLIHFVKFLIFPSFSSSSTVNNINNNNYNTNNNNTNNNTNNKTTTSFIPICIINEAFVNEYHFKVITNNNNNQFSNNKGNNNNYNNNNGIDSITLNQQANSAVELNYQLIAQKCLTTKDVIMKILKLIVKKIGLALITKKIEIEITNIGIFRGERRVIYPFQFFNEFIEKLNNTNLQQLPASSSPLLSLPNLGDGGINNNSALERNGNNNSGELSSGNNKLLLMKDLHRPTTTSSVKSYISSYSSRSLRNKQQQHHSLLSNSESGSPKVLSNSSTARGYIQSYYNNNYNTGVLSTITNATTTSATSSLIEAVMNEAYKRYEKEIEKSKKENQKASEDYYKQLLNNLYIDEMIRKERKEKAQQYRNYLKFQMENQKRQEVSDFNLNNKNVNNNVNNLLIGIQSENALPPLRRMKREEKIKIRETLEEEAKRNRELLKLKQEKEVLKEMEINNQKQLELEQEEFNKKLKNKQIGNELRQAWDIQLDLQQRYNDSFL
ncbi:hypothetical protein ABK040_005592 [Willaertia magna]